MPSLALRLSLGPCLLVAAFAAPAAADWRFEDDGEGPAEAIGPGAFGVSIRMTCEVGTAPAMRLAGLLVQGLPEATETRLTVDGAVFGPYPLACSEDGCDVGVPGDEAGALSQALRAGLSVDVDLGGETVETISLGGSNDAIGGLIDAGCTDA